MFWCVQNKGSALYFISIMPTDNHIFGTRPNIDILIVMNYTWSTVFVKSTLALNYITSHWQLILPVIDTVVDPLATEMEGVETDVHAEGELNKSGCVHTSLSKSQTCEIKTLCKQVREALASGKFIPSDIASMMNAILLGQSLNLQEIGCVQYEANKLIDCYLCSWSDDSDTLLCENEVPILVIFWP